MSKGNEVDQTQRASLAQGKTRAYKNAFTFAA
jgi:hypothetical protein